MDFVISLPLTRKRHDSIWVIVNMMTKCAFFIPVKFTYIAKDYAKIYVDDIMRWNGSPASFILDGEA